MILLNNTFWVWLLKSFGNSCYLIILSNTFSNSPGSFYQLTGHWTTSLETVPLIVGKVKWLHHLQVNIIQRRCLFLSFFKKWFEFHEWVNSHHAKLRRNLFYYWPIIVSIDTNIPNSNFIIWWKFHLWPVRQKPPLITGSNNGWIS